MSDNVVGDSVPELVVMLLWKQLRSFLAVMARQRRDEGDRMRFVTPFILIYIYIYFLIDVCHFVFNVLIVHLLLIVAADSASSRGI